MLSIAGMCLFSASLIVVFNLPMDNHNPTGLFMRTAGGQHGSDSFRRAALRTRQIIQSSHTWVENVSELIIL
jgi:hypothetical protein